MPSKRCSSPARSATTGPWRRLTCALNAVLGATTASSPGRSRAQPAALQAGRGAWRITARAESRTTISAGGAPSTVTTASEIRSIRHPSRAISSLSGQRSCLARRIASAFPKAWATNVTASRSPTLASKTFRPGAAPSVQVVDARPAVLVRPTAGLAPPPPATTWKATSTFGVGLPYRSRATTATASTKVAPTSATTSVSPSATTRAGGPGTTLAVKLLEMLADRAVSVCCPGAVPTVQVAEAAPEASVVADAGDTLPDEAPTVKPMPTPATGEPEASRAWAVTGTEVPTAGSVVVAVRSMDATATGGGGVTVEPPPSSPPPQAASHPRGAARRTRAGRRRRGGGFIVLRP